MASPTIAALRAASSASPAGPSGPQALAYPWMTATGRELVLPDRSSSPPPKRRPLPDPSPPPPGRPFIQPQLPSDDGGGRRGEAPGRGGDGWSYIGDWGSDVPPYAVIDPGYVPPSETAPPSEPQTPPQRGRDQFEFSPTPMEDFGLMDFTPQSIEPPPAFSVEVAPEPIPYMPQIVEPEALSSVPAPQPEISQSVPQSMPDLSLMEYIQPVPMAELAPEVVPQTFPAEQPEFDPQFLRYLMMSEFGGPNLR